MFKQSSYCPKLVSDPLSDPDSINKPLESKTK